MDEILFVIAFLCNLGKDLIGSKKEASTDTNTAPSANVQEPLVCDLDKPKDHPETVDASNFDLNLDFDNVVKISNHDQNEEIETITKKEKVSKEEVIAILDDMDGLVNVQDDSVVNVITSEPSAAASVASVASDPPQLTTRSGRKVKKNAKYLQ